MPTAPDSIIALLRKIKTLSDRGIEGERRAAEAALSRMLKRHGLTEADLLQPAETADHAFIAVGEDEVTLLCQCANKVLQLPGDKITFKRSRRKRSECWFPCTPLQYAELSAMWQHYRKEFRRERRRQASLLMRAMVQKYCLFAPTPATGERPAPSPEEELELMEMFRLMHNLHTKPWLRPSALLTA